MPMMYPAMPEGGSQAVMTMVVPKLLEGEADALWKSHERMMRNTHTNSGTNECLFYHVCKTNGALDHTNPTGAATPDYSKVLYTVVEFYRNRAGLEQHMDMFYAGVWEDGAKLQELLKRGDVQFNGNFFGETFAAIPEQEFQTTQNVEILSRLTPEIRAIWQKPGNVGNTNVYQGVDNKLSSGGRVLTGTLGTSGTTIRNGPATNGILTNSR